MAVGDQEDGDASEEGRGHAGERRRTAAREAPSKTPTAASTARFTLVWLGYSGAPSRLGGCVRPLREALQS